MRRQRCQAGILPFTANYFNNGCLITLRRKTSLKIGVRKPSIRKSISARTKGYANRSVKKVLNPSYSRKGSGWLHDPQKAAYNKIYRQMTTSISTTSTRTSTKTPHASRSSAYDDSSYKSITVRVDSPVSNDDHHATRSAFSIADTPIIIFLVLFIFLWVWQDFLTALCVGVILLSMAGLFAKLFQRQKSK